MHAPFPLRPSLAQRCMLLMLGVAMLVGAQAHGNPPTDAPVTIEVAVEQALARPALADSIAAAAALEDAAGEQAGLWPNPVIGYEREEIFGGVLEEAEDRALLSQSVDVSGRRGLRADAATQRGDAARLDGEARRRQVAVDARRRFWQVIHQQTRHDVVRDWVTRLEAVTALLEQRKAAGESSTYEALRLLREVQAAHMEFELASVDRDAAWLDLLALTGDLKAPAEWPRAKGDLVPAPPDTTADAGNVRPDRQAWTLREKAAQLELDAAARGWVPEFQLTAGWRTLSDHLGNRGHGLAAAISLSIPLFDRGQGEAAMAQARQAHARAEGVLLTEDVRRQRRPVERRAIRLAEMATRVRAETEATSQKLKAIAELAWLGGELPLIDLLDVHRCARDDAMATLELAHAARLAREQLRAITLDEVP